MTRKTEVIAEANGEKYCYLFSDNVVAGGGSYLSRILEARNKTKADAFVFVLPEGSDKDRIRNRIQRTVKALEDSVAPLRLPYRVSVSYASLI